MNVNSRGSIYLGHFNTQACLPWLSPQIRWSQFYPKAPSDDPQQRYDSALRGGKRGHHISIRKIELKWYMLMSWKINRSSHPRKPCLVMSLWFSNTQYLIKQAHVLNTLMLYICDNSKHPRLQRKVISIVLKLKSFNVDLHQEPPGICWGMFITFLICSSWFI